LFFRVTATLWNTHTHTHIHSCEEQQKLLPSTLNDMTIWKHSTMWRSKHASMLLYTHIVSLVYFYSRLL